MSSGKRRIRQGELITSLDQLMKCEWVMVGGKPVARGWWLNWQLRMVMNYIQHQAIYEGIRLTNDEYYEHLTNEKIEEKFGDEILPWDHEYEEKFKAWKEQPVK